MKHTERNSSDMFFCDRTGNKVSGNILRLAAVVCMTALLAGCGSGEAQANRGVSSQSAGVSDVLQQGMEAADSAAPADESAGEADGQTETAPADAKEQVEAMADAQTAESTAEASSLPIIRKPAEGVDVDLTILSSTMVYSEVFNIMYEPDDYIGKVIRMAGIYTTYTSEDTDKRYDSCFISDASACCAQGIEFELTENYAYPADYPEEGEDICVQGVFEIYEEDGYKYARLSDAEMIAE